MKRIDNSKLACPQPVINTKKAIEDGLPLVSVVDNEIAKENVLKLCKKLGLNTEVIANDNQFEISIFEGEKVDLKSVSQFSESYLITSKYLGKGDDTLGEALMKAFIYTLANKDLVPEKIMFLNSGVFLTTEGTLVLESLRELEQKGCEILSCGACLDFFQLKDKLVVGAVTNMYDIVDNLAIKKVITI